MVLSRAADHRGPTDVDILDRRRVVPAARDGCLKWIKIDHQQIDHADAVRRSLLAVLRVAAHCQQAAMDLRMESLQPPIHHFRNSGVVGHVFDGNARRFQRRRGTASRQQFHALLHQRARQLQQSRLVGHRQQGARNVLLRRCRGGGWHHRYSCEVSSPSRCHAIAPRGIQDVLVSPSSR